MSYRYPAAHKDELEWQCTAMMEQGIVCHNASAFSSLVLPIKKADGSWCFYIDYRALNTLTIKDMFPISMVDELLDKLHGAHFSPNWTFDLGTTKTTCDLAMSTRRHSSHTRYHQVCLSFGLCNTPTTFQALMNNVLQPFLRRFVRHSDVQQIMDWPPSPPPRRLHHAAIAPALRQAREVRLRCRIDFIPRPCHL